MTITDNLITFGPTLALVCLVLLPLMVADFVEMSRNADIRGAAHSARTQRGSKWT